MKRCPACKRVETDDALVFCRADGTPLVSDSWSVGADSGTVRFGSAPVASEVETSVLPQPTTDAGINRPTGSTTVLDRQQTVGRTRELVRPKRTKAIVFTSVAVLIAAIAGLAYYYYTHKSNAAISSIAVLPLQNASGDPNIEYLSDGIAESLMDSLSQLPNLKVMSRNTAFRYKGKEQDAEKIGKELNVRAVLTGSLKQVGDQIVINVSLDDTLDGRHIWGAQYDRKASDLLAVQRDIARDITGNLRLKLSGADEQKVTKNYPANEEAYQAYLKGRYYYQHFTEESETKAIERFNEAITLDPNYAQAFAGLALVYTRISAAYLPPSEAMPKAKQAVLKALALDGSLADAHLALAEIHWWNDWDFPAAEEEFKRAIELSPNEPSAYSAYAMFLAGTLGRADEAIAMANRALQLDALSLAIHSDAAFAFYYAHQYDRVAAEANKMLELDHNSVYGHAWLGAAYMQKAQYEQAIPELKKGVDPRSGEGLDRLGYTCALAGRKSEALKTLAELQALADRKYISPYALARVYSGLGEKERVFQWLEKAYAGRDDGMTKLKADPIFDSLHSDQRFTDLARRVGLPQ